MSQRVKICERLFFKQLIKMIFISYYKGNKLKAISTVSPLVKTGNELVSDPAKAKESSKQIFGN